jgi:hypothetical protein
MARKCKGKNIGRSGEMSAGSKAKMPKPAALMKLKEAVMGGKKGK